MLPDRGPSSGKVVRGERIDDATVLRDEVRMALDVSATDHLHHQIDRELAIEAREERVSREVDLELVERGVRHVPLVVGDRRVGRLEQLGEAGEPVLGSGLDGPLGCEQLERQTHVVPLRDSARRHRSHVVAAPWPHGEQPLRDESRESVVDRASRHAELFGEGVRDSASPRPAPAG